MAVRTRGLGLAVALVGGLALVAPAASGAAGRAQFVLSPEGNHLWAYDAATNQAQLVVRAVNGGDPGVAPPRGSERRDINGQVCVAPDNRHVITGEDTVLGGGSSHDPRIAGWGWHRITGSRLGQIRIKQEGKLAPEAGLGPGYTGDPDNFGCGFLGPDRLVTTAIGDTYPGQPANGQLFLWFGPFDRGYRKLTQKEGGSFFVGRVPHCEIDRTLATAGGVTVDRNGDVYVTANRPDDDGDAGSVWRYRGRWPRTARECTPEYVAKNIAKERVIPSIAAPADARATTPSSVAISRRGTLYVSSVFTGIVSEFTKTGTWLRDVYPLSPVSPIVPPVGRTPYGLAVADDDSLWIANLGIVVAAPGPGQGSVIRVRFTNGEPTPMGETVKSGLNFPDGLGVYTPR